MPLDSCADSHLLAVRRFGLLLPCSLGFAAVCGQQEYRECSSQPLPSTPSPPCKPDSPWQNIDAGEFAFALPCDMVQKPVQNLDSIVARYDSPSLLLISDYGWYSSDLREFKEEPELREESSTIGGKPARIVTVRSADAADGRPFIAAVAFASVGPVIRAQKTRLTMQAHGRTAADQETAKRIFRSIQFKQRPRLR